jgi:hypothetical protein
VTYPPQQPGPNDPQGGGYPQSGGFPQQPGGYQPNPQSGGFQQPGGYPPGGGYEQQGGYQQPGGYQQQPGGYQPGYPQPGGYQQPGMGGFQPGFPGGMPPQRKSALPWILTGGGVLVVGVVILLLFVFGVFGGGSGANTSNPKDVAQAYVTALNNNDSSTMKSLACSVPSQPTGTVPTGVVPTDIPQEKFNLQLDGDPTVSGNTATGKAKGTVNGSNVEYQYQLNNNNGSWCVDLTKLKPVMNNGNGGSSSDSSSDNSSGSEEPSQSTGSGSSSTNINFDELQVGSCMAGDPEATTLSGYSNADCSSSDATMKILSIFQNSTHDEFESDSEDPCNDVPQTYFPMWHGDENGVTGTIYCVGKTGS